MAAASPPYPRPALVLRAAALVCALALPAGCTASARSRLACEHCACAPGDRDLSHPITCETLSLDQWMSCCVSDGS